MTDASAHEGPNSDAVRTASPGRGTTTEPCLNCGSVECLHAECMAGDFDIVTLSDGRISINGQGHLPPATGGTTAPAPAASTATADPLSYCAVCFRDMPACPRCWRPVDGPGAQTCNRPHGPTHDGPCMPAACEWCGRAIRVVDSEWWAVKGIERGYDPLYCEAADDTGRHSPTPTGTYPLSEETS